VSWRGQIYTIKSFGDLVGRFGTRTIEFEEPLHVADEVPDEIAVDFVQAAPLRQKGTSIQHALNRREWQTREPCTNGTPPWFTGRWRDWHRGHGCDRDDGQPRSAEAMAEIAQHETCAATGFLTDAELRMLRASTTSGNELLVRALDELVARRAADKVREKLHAAPSFDHSARRTKHFDPLLEFCICMHCAKLPECE
jgi:hypothetical protein